MGFSLHERLAADCAVLGDFTVCRLLLMNDAQYPWAILVPRVPDIRELYQLDDDVQVQVLRESSCLSRVLMDLYQGEKLNVAALGNMVPQLHIHHVVRFSDDPAWPGPIWGRLPPRAYEKEALEREKSRLCESLSQADQVFKAL